MRINGWLISCDHWPISPVWMGPNPVWNNMHVRHIWIHILCILQIILHLVLIWNCFREIMFSRKRIVLIVLIFDIGGYLIQLHWRFLSCENDYEVWTMQLLYKLIESDVQNYYKTQTSHHLLNWNLKQTWWWYTFAQI